MKRAIILLIIFCSQSALPATLFIKPGTEQTIEQGDAVKLELFLVVKKGEELHPVEIYNKVLGKTLFIANPHIVKEQETPGDKNYLIDADVVFSNEVMPGRVLSHDFKTTKLNIIISNVKVAPVEAEKEFLVFDQDFYPALNSRQLWQNLGAIALLFLLIGYKFYRKLKQKKATAEIINQRTRKIYNLIEKMKSAQKREDFEEIYLQKQVILSEALVPKDEFKKLISKIENYLYKKDLNEFDKNEMKKYFINFVNALGKN